MNYRVTEFETSENEVTGGGVEEGQVADDLGRHEVWCGMVRMTGCSRVEDDGGDGYVMAVSQRFGVDAVHEIDSSRVYENDSER
ncbi:Hypothetical predicted protein [Olea europaea subsp. europaea]|uniref:Uncharacterized protein n=1 Tax=Olea europaea subsp. europaea TaxID=158383 RepID=A0A8S0RG43_OLEEU|nr:Hypothetical predicted protein [Olea europaea subsp. europaea]